MSTQDEEIQKKLEAGSAVEPDLDSIAYQRVFKSISAEPDFHLSPRFTDRVLSKLNTSEGQSANREMYWLAAGVFVLVMAAAVGAFLTGFKPSFGAFKFWNRNVGLFVFGVAFLAAIQWLDKKLFRTTPL